MHSEKKSYVTVGFQCWQRLGFNPSAEQSQRSNQTTRVLVLLQGSFAITLCLHSHFVKMVLNSEQMDVWIKT